MPVVVTGAAGRLGSVSVPFLVQQGLDIVATDRRPAPEAGFPLVPCDLRDRRRVAEVLEGADAVVHLATEGYTQLPAAILENNILATTNVLEAGLAAGVRKFVFASSIQVFAPEGNYPAEVSSLPLDGRTPPNPRTAYGFSKVAEEILFHFLPPNGSDVTVIRFPALVHPSPDAGWGRLRPFSLDESSAAIEQGFSCLSFRDAARLLEACLRRSLPGYRTYLPAISVVEPAQIAAYVRRYYHQVPLKVPLNTMTSLTDISEIERETGWRPEDMPVQAPPPPPPRRSILRSFLAKVAQRLGGA